MRTLAEPYLDSIATPGAMGSFLPISTRAKYFIIYGKLYTKREIFRGKIARGGEIRKPGY